MIPVHDSASIFDHWQRARVEAKGLHALELAESLGVSELALLASACGRSSVPEVVRLELNAPSFLAELPSLGTVKAVTRNRHAVIEVVGNYDNIAFFGPNMGQSVGTIDLRIFAGRWRHAFAVKDETRRGISRSVQFFDEHGTALHKLFLRESSDVGRYEGLIRAHTSADQSPEVTTSPTPVTAVPRPDEAVDVEGLRRAWHALTDTHAFFGLLRQFEVSRTQALRLVGAELARPVSPRALGPLLESAAKAGTDIMVFVGNAGVIQIYSGPVHKIVKLGDWLNVLDPGFDLHLRETAVASAWVVRKPTVDGVVTSLELYDATGEQLALVVGKRHGGEPEQPGWRAQVEALS
jgi:putative hemin transport protein